MLELTPITPNPSFARLVLFVEPQHYQVVEAGVIDAQNNRNRFQFIAGTVRVNTNPPLDRFRWTPPPGTNVIRP
jgi:outer membrane lipoprotein-sorting protein